ncbi:hypothetical protein KO561_03765 [Radiobacillus kanasensis]|uniref:hypothetical protein n=1 Tax=Radiobacillus kanasensis TaxID=2844358 RepID=UPI001E5489DD|nr:hypothetical protein [Radiobacillus kanasensis]UFU00092.1 hypothetical protein KO561_03765 [Radiobacillus kanasensis]
MEEEIQRDGRNVLLTVSWIAVFLPYLFSPIAVGPIAFCLGVVLNRDYEVGNQGKIIKTLAVVNTFGGIIFANWLRFYLGA